MKNNNQKMREAVAELHNSLDDSLGQLENITQEKISAIQKITIKGDSILEEKINENTSNFNKLAYLKKIYDHLHKNDKINKVEINMLSSKLNNLDSKIKIF